MKNSKNEATENLHVLIKNKENKEKNCSKNAIFIAKARNIHGGNYDYSKLDYKNAHTKIIINCDKHGDFLQKPNSHLNGQGCPKCAKNFKLNVDQFIERASVIHDNKYDYSEVVYKSRAAMVTIFCKQHGKFKQRAGDHLNGHGCKKCGFSSSQQNQSLGFDDFVVKANKVHQDKYSYVKIDYTNNKGLVTICCSKHGLFEQQIGNHLAGMGCRECAIVDNALDSEEFIERAKILHGNKYDYSKVSYVNSFTKINIICSKHGEFQQRPNSHLDGRGCPKCPGLVSKGHQELADFIVDNYDKEVILNYRDASVGRYEVDIWLPDIKVGFEYHGVYYHSSNNTHDDKKLKNYHKNKAIEAEENGFVLYQIFSNEFPSDIWKSMILNVLGKSDKVYARKCDFLKLDNKQERCFFDANHLQGYNSSTVSYALCVDDTIVAAMSFKKRREHFEIHRYACKRGISVIGGASRLFVGFVRRHAPKLVYTFADRRYSVGRLYDLIGFTRLDDTKPNYKYTNTSGSMVLGRHCCQKHKLLKLLKSGFNASLTEHENMFQNGYRRIWDAGNAKFVWKSKN